MDDDIYLAFIRNCFWRLWLRQVYEHEGLRVALHRARFCPVRDRNNVVPLCFCRSAIVDSQLV